MIFMPNASDLATEARDGVAHQTDASAPLSAFEVVSTSDENTARSAMLDTYGAMHFARLGHEPEFEARAHLVKLKDITISYHRYSSGVEIEFPPASYVRQQICLSGIGKTSFGDQTIDLDPVNWSALVPAGVPAKFDYMPNFSHVMFWIESDKLERAHAAMMGTPVQTLAFRRQADVTSFAMQSLRRAVAFLVRELDAGGQQTLPPGTADIESMIITRFLLGHQPEVAPDQRPGLVPPRPRMRRLEEFLHENWSQPLTIETLAETTGVGARSIFRYFKETRGCTPLDYMKGLRLEQARRALQNPSCDTTVSSEALRCGFNNMGHFAKDYRRKFGELPSETLFKARLR